MSSSSPTLAVDTERYMSVSTRSRCLHSRGLCRDVSIKVENAVNLLESNVQSKSGIILFEALMRVLSSDCDAGYEYVEFIALLKEKF